MYFDEIQLFLFFLPLPPFLLTFRLFPSLLLSYKKYTWFCISTYNPEFTNRRKHYFLGLLILLSIVISSPVHFPANVMILFFYQIIKLSYVYSTCFLFTHSIFDGHLGWCHNLTIIIRAAVDLAVQVSLPWVDLEFFGNTQK